MRTLIIALSLLALGLGSANADVDDMADVSVARPSFARDTGPIVGVDSGHFNFHTIDNLYRPFAALLRNDGFRVLDAKASFTSESLAGLNVLVISDALPSDKIENWVFPTPAAFTAAEIDAVKSWVSAGGSLLLIADHLPFSGAAAGLARAFGFRIESGVASAPGTRLTGPPNERGPDTFTRADGSLTDDVITRGRRIDEAISALSTFRGSAFHAPADARPIIVLPEGYAIHECGMPCPETVPKFDAKGLLQGAVLKFGKGRISVFGDATMFTAQFIPGSPPFPVGFNAVGAEQNKQFVLNLMRWLSGVLPEA
jgi:hypothetical protein